jgi:hypothetical protein
MSKAVFTESDARAYVAENLTDIMEALANDKTVPPYLKGGRFDAAWQAGYWLNAKLRELGADEKVVLAIGFCHGQRSLFGDPWKWAVAYLNEFSVYGFIADRPGNELADEINTEVFGPKFAS